MGFRPGACEVALWEGKMEHWFDDRCKRLVADPKVSRRTALGVCWQAWRRPARICLVVATRWHRPHPQGRLPRFLFPHSCRRRMRLSDSSQLGHSGRVYRSRWNNSSAAAYYDRASHVVTSSTTISRTGPGLPRSTLIIQFETRPSVPRGTITTVDYGPEVKGVQHVAMTSQDGKTFQGSMDGRTFTTSGIPRSLSAVRFADGKPPPTLKIGDLAPLLELRDLSGKIIGLRDVLGGRVLVLFWNPRCGFCQQMLNDLREWEAGPPPEAPMLVVVSTGTMEENRAMGLRSQVLIDDDFKAATAFGATGTPAGVLIDATGRIASKVTAGAQAVLALANALPLQMTEPSLSLVRATTSEVRATMSG